jgi:hypothetical protein
MLLTHVVAPVPAGRFPHLQDEIKALDKNNDGGHSVIALVHCIALLATHAYMLMAPACAAWR